MFQTTAEQAKKPGLDTEMRNYISTSLNEEVEKMPEVEREMKLGKIESYSRQIPIQIPDLIRSKMQKYSAFAGAGVAGGFLLFTCPWALATAPVAYGVGRWLERRRSKMYEKLTNIMRDASYKAYALDDEIKRNLDVYKTAGHPEKKLAELKKAQQDLKEIAKEDTKRGRWLSKRSTWTTLLLTGGVIGAGVATGMALPGIISACALTSTLVGSIQSYVLAKAQESKQLKEQAKNYDDMAHKPEFDLQTGNQKLPQNADTIHVDHIQYSYRKTKDGEMGQRGESPVLNFSKDFYFKPGINILAGNSGVGKSTLYKLLRHGDDLSGGSISFGSMKNGKFEGEKLTDLSLEEATKPAVFAFQEIKDANISGVDLIRAYRPDLSEDSLKRIAKLLDIPLWLDKECKQARPLWMMSGGEKKRTQFAAAMMSDKKIIVLDEPTSGTDKKTASVMLEQVNKIAEGKTIIYTTHSPDELLKLNVSNIVGLQKKNENGPADVEIFPCETKEDIEKYVHSHQPQLQETEEDKPKPENQPQDKDDLAKISRENVPDEEEKGNENQYIKRMKDEEGTQKGAHLRALLRDNCDADLKKKLDGDWVDKTIDKIDDRRALSAMRDKADPVRHKRLYKALHNSQR